MENSYQEHNEGQSDLLLSIYCKKKQTKTKTMSNTEHDKGEYALRICMLTGWCVQRVVDVVGHPCCKTPVVATVLKCEGNSVNFDGIF